MRSAVVYSTLVVAVWAHGLCTSMEGANGVSNGCGSQADTSIIRDREISNGKASPLGRTEGGGPVSAAASIEYFMTGAGTAQRNKGANGATGQEDDLSALGRSRQRREEHKRQIGKLFGGAGAGAGAGLGGLLGGLGGAGRGSAAGGGGKKSNFAEETMVADTAGQGATSGLPTTNDQGEISMVFRQINQDGAGPMRADIDATSGGTDPSAFQRAEVTQDIPGLGIGGLSLATNTEFPLKVQMPPGMTCEAQVGGASNVCIVRVRNSAAAGPFGGSGAFTQSPSAKKRAIAYRLRKRFQISRVEDKDALDAADAAELEEEEDDDE
ncbi:cell surface protein [Drechmeria coniospora]|uniref:Cell surface protein n=1 Tax=Drechmeria coniospora TaxID=98403 RepID=A0A151GPR5_DRECN|nr:cell surface protein [Drechmeria coniospora]KYK59099.1 cell surface protein [Drechmeria coniospora]